MEQAPTSGQDTDERKIFVGGLNYDSEPGSIRSYFEQFGEVVHVDVKTHPDSGRSRGFGFVIFKNKENVDTLLKGDKKGHIIDGSTIELKKAIPQDQSQSQGGDNKGNRIYVKGTRSLTEADLKGYFTGFGEVVDVFQGRDVDESVKDYAFITFSSASSAEQAVSQRTPHTINGSVLEVKYATPKTPKNGPRGGGRGGWGGGGGRNQYSSRGGYGGSQNNWDQGGYSSGGYGGGASGYGSGGYGGGGGGYGGGSGGYGGGSGGYGGGNGGYGGGNSGYGGGAGGYGGAAGGYGGGGANYGGGAAGYGGNNGAAPAGGADSRYGPMKGGYGSGGGASYHPYTRN